MDDSSAGAPAAAPAGAPPAGQAEAEPAAAPRAQPAAAGPLAGAEWPARVADIIEETVGSVHDRVVRPLIVAARAVVFGIVVGVMALVVAVSFSIAAVRMLTVYVFDGRVWASDLLVGGLFLLIGVIAWSQRHSGEIEGG